MADNTLPTPTNNEVPSTDIRDHVYAGAMLDKAMTGTALTYTDRKGGEHDTWPGIEKKSADKLSELDNIITSLDTASFTFESVAAGLAGTSDGQYFRKPGSADGITAWDYYRNVSGTAQYVTSLLSNKMLSIVTSGDLFSLRDKNGEPILLLSGDGRLYLPLLSNSVQDVINQLKKITNALSKSVKQASGDDLFRGHDSSGNIVSRQTSDGHFYLPHLSESVQEILNRVNDITKALAVSVSVNAGIDLFNWRDTNGNTTILQSSDGRLYLPLLSGSVQDEINNLKQSAGAAASVITVESRNQVGTAVYAVLPDGFTVSKLQWLRDGVAIAGTTGQAYILTDADVGKNITLSATGIAGGYRVNDSASNRIGGIALESTGATGTIYEGYTLSAGDDFNELDIISPANPLGRWFTTRTYLNPPRGSDTLLGTMFDADPAFTGHNDSNRGRPVGFDNMRVDGGVLRLQARAATEVEKLHVQGNRHDLASMVSSVGAFSFYAGAAGGGECIIEWCAMFTHKTRNPEGWHPSLWTQSSLPSYTYDSDEMDIVEGNSQLAASNYNIWGPNGNRTGGGSLGGLKDIFDGTYHKVTAILSRSSVQIYIDDKLFSTAAIDANAVQEPGYLLMSSHIYNGEYHGDTYNAEAWEQLWKGATINVDWCRIWRRTGKSHVTPKTTIPPVNIDYGSGGTIILPAKSALWGRDDVLEHVQVVMTEENEPGGSHTTPYNTLPPFVTYDATTRTITISNGYTKAGRLNFVIYGYLKDGSSCEPARTYANIGPNITASAISMPRSGSFDLYAACDCGVLVTDGKTCTKKIAVYGLPEGAVYDSDSGLLRSLGASAFSGSITIFCANSVGQFVTKSLTLTIS